MTVCESMGMMAVYEVRIAYPHIPPKPYHAKYTSKNEMDGLHAALIMQKQNGIFFHDANKRTPENMTLVM